MSRRNEGGLLAEQGPGGISGPERRWTWPIVLTLIALIGVIYWQVQAHEFLNYDDDEYVTRNSHVQGGLTFAGVAWALTTADFNWHPLTWLSHMLDCELFGLDAGAHHLVNILFHLIDTLLLLAVLRRITGDWWRSVFVTALFAVHPLHVESVAWIAERKDVLSRMFWMLTMLAYVRYVEKPGATKMLWVALSLALGLMCKQMLVTLPFVLLLLDFWPLGRFRFASDVRTAGRGQVGVAPASFARIVGEKIPLFLIVAGASVLTVLAQRQVNAVVSLADLPLSARIENALVAYVRYLGKIFWPAELAIPYPHPGTSLPTWSVAGSALVIVVVSAAVVVGARRCPYLATGWLWFMGTLVPVIGLVQVGLQGMADRYVYGPAIGIFIMVAWAVPALTHADRWRRTALSVTAVLVVAVLSARAWVQTRYWRDSVTLFTHTLQVTENNSRAHFNLAFALEERGDLDQALEHYTRAVTLRPDYAEAHNNLGSLLVQRGELDRGIEHFAIAARERPGYASAYNNWGFALRKQGKVKQAIGLYRAALQADPTFAMAHNNLGIALELLGNTDEAIEQYRLALAVEPDHSLARANLRRVLSTEQHGPSPPVRRR